MRRLLKNLAVALAVAALIPPAMAWATGQNVSGVVNRNQSFTEVATVGLNTNNVNASIVTSISYANGTGVGQVDTIYARSLTLAGTTTTLDLTNLTDPVGNTISFARVREFIVTNADTTAAHTVKVSGAASNGVTFLPINTAPLTLQAQGTGTVPGAIAISDPNGTGASNGNYVDATHKNILLDPSANTVTISILIVGGSAAFVVALPFGLRRRFARRRAA